jgi:hypothetical protein
MRNRKLCLLAVVALSLLYWATPLLALDDEVHSLQGVKALFILVEIVDPEIEKEGITREVIQSDTEQRLHKAGIKVLSKKEWLGKKGGGYLYVNINARKVSHGIYLHGISLELVQKVLLVRNPKREVFAATWSRQLLGQGGYPDRIRYSVQDMVDLFLHFWAKANQK